MDMNLDVWAIQYYKEELQNALANIKKESRENILFTNCLSNLRIGSNNINTTKFDTVLFSKDSDTLILLMKDGEAKATDIKKYLLENDIIFHEVNFAFEDQSENKDTLKELWFAREKYVLDDALNDSKNKGINSCTYYPNITGELELKYQTNNKKIENLAGIMNIKGIINFEDKNVLLIDNQSEININAIQIFKSLSDGGVSVNVDLDNDISIDELSYSNESQKTI